jgi:hypothetical protein
MVAARFKRPKPEMSKRALKMQVFGETLPEILWLSTLAL